MARCRPTEGMSNVIPFRRPAGVPTGGQFAAQARPEADVSLDSPAADRSVDTPSEFELPAPAVDTSAPSDYYPDVRGSKYTGWRDAASIAKDVRSDIKEAVKAGHLPSSVGGHDIAYSVTCHKY